MGLFSFLKKSTDGEAAEAGTTTAAPPAPAAAEPPVPAADQSDSPFDPPREWDMDVAALTAPLPPSGDQPQVGPADPVQTAELQPKIVEALKTVYDPEIPVDIYELGLIYEIIVDAERRVLVNMTLTSPACPSAQQIPSEVRYKIKALPEVTDAWVEIVWEPPWDKDRMSEAAKLQLGFF